MDFQGMFHLDETIHLQQIFLTDNVLSTLLELVTTAHIVNTLGQAKYPGWPDSFISSLVENDFLTT